MLITADGIGSREGTAEPRFVEPRREWIRLSLCFLKL